MDVQEKKNKAEFISHECTHTPPPEHLPFFYHPLAAQHGTIPNRMGEVASSLKMSNLWCYRETGPRKNCLSQCYLPE